MKRRRAVLFALYFGVIALIGCSGSADTSSDDSTSGPVDASSTPGQLALRRLVVGTDIEPGLNIADELATCYYARISTVDGSPDDALGQANALGSQVFVNVEPTDAALISEACGSWRLATDADLKPTANGGIPDDGMWLIPEHITPGTYQTVASDLPPGCFYQTLSDVSASIDAVLDTEQGLTGQATMTIGDDVRAVRAYRCGEWKKVSG